MKNMRVILNEWSVILSGVRSTKWKNLALFMIVCAFTALFAACGGDGGTNASDIHSGVSSDSKVGSSFNYGEMTDNRDGQVYKTVTIGNQTWMAENLNYAYLQPTAYEDSSSFCYENEPDSCAKYGRLYLWSAAMDSAAVFSATGKGCGHWETCNVASKNSKIQVRGICPQGWHLPSYAEWDELVTTVGGEDSAGVKLKSTSGWYKNGNGLDSYGFGALPAGSRLIKGNFSYAGNCAYFWSSTDYLSNYAYYWDFYYFHESVIRDYYPKDGGLSVRCLRD